MTATLSFLGAAGTVTGSKFLVEGPDSRLMVDCGLYQGERRWRRLDWDEPRVPADTLDDVVVTHAHLDHCGYLPALVRQGYSGPVWATAGTALLADIVLRDSARLQEEDAIHATDGGWSRHDPPLPLYSVADAERAIARFETRPYDEPFSLSAGGSVTFGRAGHILGSSTALVELGESSVVIPAFAVDRTELVLLALARLVAAGSIPEVPVYVDSPMALARTRRLQAAGVCRRARRRRTRRAFSTAWSAGGTECR